MISFMLSTIGANIAETDTHFFKYTSFFKVLNSFNAKCLFLL